MKIASVLIIRAKNLLVIKDFVAVIILQRKMEMDLIVIHLVKIL
jgi:hypothetical protein